MDLALVSFLLVRFAPEPVLHCMNGGGGLVEDHSARNSVCSLTQGPGVPHGLQSSRTSRSCASRWSRPRRSRWKWRVQLTSDVRQQGHEPRIAVVVAAGGEARDACYPHRPTFLAPSVL